MKTVHWQCFPAALSIVCHLELPTLHEHVDGVLEDGERGGQHEHAEHERADRVHQNPGRLSAGYFSKRGLVGTSANSNRNQFRR